MRQQFIAAVMIVGAVIAPVAAAQWTGAHRFTIQCGPPVGSTPGAIKAETIELANAIIPKLR